MASAFNELLGVDVNQLDRGRWRRNRQSIRAKAFQMKLDGLANQPHRLLPSVANRDAAGQVWHARTERVLALLDDDHVVHYFLTLQAGLPQSAVKRSWRNVHARLTRHGDGTRFC